MLQVEGEPRWEIGKIRGRNPLQNRAEEVTLVRSAAGKKFYRQFAGQQEWLRFPNRKKSYLLTRLVIKRASSFSEDISQY